MKYMVMCKKGKFYVEDFDKLHTIEIGVIFTEVEAETEEQAIEIAKERLKKEINNDSCRTDRGIK